MLRVLLCLSLFACAASSPSKSVRYDSPPTSALANRPQAWQDITVTNRRSNDDGEQLVTEASVRHRTLASAPGAAVDVVGTAVGSLFSGQQAPGPVSAQPLGAAKTDPEKLVVEAWIDMRVEDPALATAAIRAQVEADGGRVISENVIGPQNKASSAAMELRVPPAKAAGFQVWLASKGLIESRRVLATDVGKQLFDQELALKNLDVTMTRLQKLAEKDASMKELIEIENEMTRVRGQIERLKGENRWLLDRVSFATITLTLSREGGPVEFAPHARIHPGVHLSTLSLVDPGDRQRTRVGGGATIHIKRWLTFDFDLFPQRGEDSRAVVGTFGSALYSSFLGGGRRAFLNPYLGYRFGVGYLSGDTSAVLGAEVGLELYKHKYVQIGVALRALAFLREGRDTALHGQFGFEVPF
ncbi:MAG: DUF4349 domain-containing protein [Deltaproteobacteria bacterium]|nr:DUF4349 domain-containing protein [Deltaproteobacteria bacterium]